MNVRNARSYIHTHTYVIWCGNNTYTAIHIVKQKKKKKLLHDAKSTNHTNIRTLFARLYNNQIIRYTPSSSLRCTCTYVCTCFIIQKFVSTKKKIYENELRRKIKRNFSGSFIFKLALMLISIIITGSQCQKSHSLARKKKTYIHDRFE